MSMFTDWSLKVSVEIALCFSGKKKKKILKIFKGTCQTNITKSLLAVNIYLAILHKILSHSKEKYLKKTMMSLILH